MSVSDFAAALWDLTVGDVEAVTAVTVEQEDLVRAAETIEIYTNRTPAASGNMLKRDIRWIKKAICWQAAWLLEQPDFHGRLNVNRVNQDGQVVDFGPGASDVGREYGINLAPMASRALKNLSWKASRSMRVPRDTHLNTTEGASAFLTADSPWDADGWSRL